MFENPGASIKKVATVIFVIEVILAVILAVSLIASGASAGYAGGIVAGIVVLIVGPIFSWLAVVCLYGFGQLIENSDKQTEYARKTAESAEKNTNYARRMAEAAERNAATPPQQYPPQFSQQPPQS